MSATSRRATPPPCARTARATSTGSRSTRSRTPLPRSSTYRNRDERRAARHYRLRGYRILGANVWAGGYELDLIVRRGRKLVFVEVKGKSGSGYGDPLEMVNEEKLRRMRRAAETWLAAHPECRDLDCRFDVIAVRVRALERVTV